MNKKTIKIHLDNTGMFKMKTGPYVFILISAKYSIKNYYNKLIIK